MYHHHWQIMNGTYPQWKAPEGWAPIELKIGVSQLLWVNKSAITFLGLNEQCNVCSGQSSGHYPHYSVAESNVNSSSPSEAEKPPSRKQPQIVSHPVQPLPLPDHQYHHLSMTMTTCCL